MQLLLQGPVPFISGEGGEDSGADMEGLGKSSFGWSLSAPRSSVRFQPPLWIP